MILERLDLPCDGVLLKGKAYLPTSLEECKGIVIFLHGLGYCDRQYKISGEYFAERGYLFLTYNQRGHAGAPGKWSLQSSVSDLIRIIDIMTERYSFKNNGRICVIGHSVGALIVLLASLKDPRIKFGSIVTVATGLEDCYEHWFKSGFNRDVREFFKTRGVIPPIIERFLDDAEMLQLYREGKIPKDQLAIPHRYGMLRSESWDEFLREIANSADILQDAHRLTLPLLLFRGEYDEVVDVQKTNELYEKLNRMIPSKLYVTHSRNHFQDDSIGLIQSETLKFFDAFCAFTTQVPDASAKDILIVDDDALVARALETVLSKNGFAQVTVAHRGEEALAKILELQDTKHKEFDLIIMDIRMPGLDGIATAKRIKEVVVNSSGDRSPIIFMTAYQNDQTREEARALGYVDYLYKPFPLEDFLSSVRKHLK